MKIFVIKGKFHTTAKWKSPESSIHSERDLIRFSSFVIEHNEGQFFSMEIKKNRYSGERLLFTDLHDCLGYIRQTKSDEFQTHNGINSFVDPEEVKRFLAREFPMTTYLNG